MVISMARVYTLTPRVRTVPTLYTRDMGDTTRMGIKEIRAALGQRIDAAYFLGENTVLTKNNQDRAAIVPLSVLEKAARLDAYEAKHGPLSDSA